MMETHKMIKLGDNHFYLLGEISSFDLDDYLQSPQHWRDQICTSMSKFGENPPGILISETNGRRWFFGRMRYTVSEAKKHFPPGKLVARLEDEVRELFMPIKNFCDIFEQGPSCYVTYPPKYANNDDLITFENYINMTR